MVTPKELRERPVLLELCLERNISKLQWFIENSEPNAENNYFKLEQMNGKDLVNHMLTDALIMSEGDTVNNIRKNIIEYINTKTKGLYSLAIKGKKRIIRCEFLPTEEVVFDEREDKIHPYLIDKKTKDGTQIRYQEFRIVYPRYL